MIVLDTNAWIWWVADPSKLSLRARRAIKQEEAKGAIVVSVISVWEIALKHSLGKLILDRDVRAWLRMASQYPGISVAPLTIDDAMEGPLLPGNLHRDPADRFIVALSRRLGAPIITKDGNVRRYPHVQTLW